MGTVADLVCGSFRRIGVIESNALPTPEDLRDGFARLKGMLGMWRLQRLTVPVWVRAAGVTLTPGKASYTIGPGGDFNVPRPAQPTALQWILSDQNVNPPWDTLLTPLTAEQYFAIPQKTLTAPYPQFIRYQPLYDSAASGWKLGCGGIWLYPVPTQPNLFLTSVVPWAVNDPVNVTDTFIVPDGYDLPLMDNLACVLWPEWRAGVPIDPQLRDNADTGLYWIKTANVKPSELAIDPMWSSFAAAPSILIPEVPSTPVTGPTGTEWVAD